MVNEIDGYKAPTESQSSRPLPACWMVKEIARYGGAQVQFSFQSDSPSSKLEGVCSSRRASAVSFQSRSPSSKLEGVGKAVALASERKGTGFSLHNLP